MRRRLGTLGLLILCSCIADMRLAIYSTDRHVADIAVANRSDHIPAEERRELIDFHVKRALAWTTIMRKHKGDADPVPTIPHRPEDKREIDEEDALMAEYESDVDTEIDLGRKVRGALSGILAGVGVSGGSGILALFMQYRKKLRALLRAKDAIVQAKDRAIDQYDQALDTLPQAKRKKIGMGIELRQEHAVRRNGGVEA